MEIKLACKHNQFDKNTQEPNSHTNTYSHSIIGLVNDKLHGKTVTRINGFQSVANGVQINRQ